MDTVLIIIVALGIIGLPVGTFILYAINLGEEYDRQQQFGDEPLTDGTKRYEGNKRHPYKDFE